MQSQLLFKCARDLALSKRFERVVAYAELAHQTYARNVGHIKSVKESPASPGRGFVFVQKLLLGQVPEVGITTFGLASFFHNSWARILICSSVGNAIANSRR